MKPKVIVLRAAGTNCDVETAYAFEISGADAERVHINQLIRKERKLKDYHILAIPGGFTYGDDIASGKILANELKYKLKDDILKFIEKKRLIIGICNGFQILVKSGFLPNLGSGFNAGEATLSLNDSAKYEDRWVYLNRPRRSAPTDAVSTECIWTEGIEDIIYLPVAHAEGKFIPRDEKIRDALKKNGQVVFQYVDGEGDLAGYPYNPNGSVDNIAGICDKTGRIFGLMPHPERHLSRTNHPQWTRKGAPPSASRLAKGPRLRREASEPRRTPRGEPEGHGLKIFRNGVAFIRKS